MSAPLKRALMLSALCWTDLSEQAGFDRTIDVHCREASADEKAAVRSILYGALRRAIFLERLVGKLVSRKPAPEVAALLAVALSQLMDMPEKPYAVVNEAIEAARLHSATARASGLINACLRRYLRERKTLDKALLADRVVRLNAPAWWIDRMAKEFGRDQIEALFETLHKKPPLTLRVNLRKTSVEKWLALAAAEGCPARSLGAEAVLLEKARPVYQIPGFSDGLVSVQDAGAQLAGLFLAPKDGERILDACAAPGGKTAHLLELADCSVTALETDAQRAPRINENPNRLALQADVRVCDAGDIDAWWDGRPFDAVLLDAPCTASGIVRRHPEIVFSRRPQDIVALAQQQKRLLNALWRVVKPGGRLLYAVCSVFSEEGTEQIEAFLKEHKDAEAITLPKCHDSQLRLMPCDNPDKLGLIDGPHDGFFYALLQKN